MTQITQQHIDSFVSSVFDNNPIHTNDGIVPGMMIIGLAEEYWSRYRNLASAPNGNVPFCKASFRDQSTCYDLRGVQTQQHCAAGKTTYYLVQDGKKKFTVDFGLKTVFESPDVSSSPTATLSYGLTPAAIANHRKSLGVSGNGHALYSQIAALVPSAMLDASKQICGTYEGQALSAEFDFNPNLELYRPGQFTVDLFLELARSTSAGHLYRAKAVVCRENVVALTGRFTAAHPQNLLAK